MIIKAVKILVFFVTWSKIQLSESSESCTEWQKNTRLVASVLETGNVYTVLQCQDKCFRNQLCNAFNFFKQNAPLPTNNCELLGVTTDASITSEDGWIYSKINRTEIRAKFFGNDCQKQCGERQKCNRELDACGYTRCVCKDGFLDDGSGTCSLRACTAQGLLKGNSGRIETPTTLISFCGDPMKRLIPESFTCYYQILFDEVKNLVLHFTTLKLFGGIPSSCGIASQYLDVNNSTYTMRICGDYGSSPVGISTSGKKVTLKFFFDRFTDSCVQIIGQYTVN